MNIEKIRAGKKAQRTKDFMICARIESLSLERGMEDALERAFAFTDAGADAISFHVEADCDVRATLAAIRARGLRAGIVLKPATPAEAVKPFICQFDYVLVMTVEPGYGGQAFMDGMKAGSKK